MKNIIAQIILLALLIFLLCFDPPTVPNISQFENLYRWFTEIHVASNAYYLWKFDKPLAWLSTALGISNTTFILLLNLIIFAAGNACLIFYLLKQNQVLIIIILTTTFPIIFGFDTVLLSAFAYLPWLILSFLASREKNVLGFIFIIIFATRLIGSANFLAPTIAIFAILLSLSLEHVQNTKIKYTEIFYSLFFILVSYSFFYLPEPFWPDYPQIAKLVPDDDFPGHLLSLTNPRFPIPSINESFLKTWLLLPLLAITAYCSVLLLFFKNRLNYVILTVCILIILHLKLPAYLANILPVSTASRIIPGNNYYPFVLVLTFFIIYGLQLSLLVQNKSTLALLTSLIFISFFGSNFFLKTGKLTLNSFLLPVEDKQVITNYSKLNQFKSKLVSPSLFAIKNSGLEILNLPDIRKLKFKLLNRKKIEITSSGSDTSLLSDKEPNTRWHLKQNGQEWIHIKFPKEVKVKALDLNPGSYFTDAPVAIEIYGTNNCSLNFENYSLLYKQDPFEGTLLLTSLGFPYYNLQNSANSMVKIWLGNNTKVQCLLIKQSGKSDILDWSITDLRAVWK